MINLLNILSSYPALYEALSQPHRHHQAKGHNSNDPTTVFVSYIYSVMECFIDDVYSICVVCCYECCGYFAMYRYVYVYAYWYYMLVVVYAYTYMLMVVYAYIGICLWVVYAHW